MVLASNVLPVDVRLTSIALCEAGGRRDAPSRAMLVRRPFGAIAMVLQEGGIPTPVTQERCA